MSLSINIVNVEDEHNVDKIKEELRDVNEKIIQFEKRLFNANKNLTYLYSSDKDFEQAYLSGGGEEDDRELCERQIVNFGETLASLEHASTSHEHQVAALRSHLAHLLTLHGREREKLKERLVSLKLTLLLNRNKKKSLQTEDLDVVLNKQAVLEQEVVRLRSRQLQLTPGDSKMSNSGGMRVLKLREQHQRTANQLEQTQQILSQQNAEREQLAHVSAQAAAKNTILKAELRSLKSDLDMANLEYADVRRQYNDAQRENRVLKDRVEDANTSRLLSGFSQRHKEAIWRVITLDATIKREKQRYRSLHEKLLEHQRSERN